MTGVDYRTETGIQCLDCGKWFRALSTHVIRAHGYRSAAAYREAHGLLKRGLVSEELAARLAVNAKKMGLPELGMPTRIPPGVRPGPKRLSDEGRQKANGNLIPAGGLEQAHEARRGITHCVNGHEFTPENTLIVSGFRRCRICSNSNRKRLSVKHKGLTPPSHGVYGYREYACRCSVCREAATAARRRSREASNQESSRP